MSSRSARLGALCAVCICVGLSGCGGSSAPAHNRATVRSAEAQPATVCLPLARSNVAAFLGLPSARVATAASTGNNAMPQCSFTAITASGAHVTVTANVDTSPSPYFRLQRTAVETNQMFTPGRFLPAPQPVSGIGIDAYWFPPQTQLMSTDGSRLVTATVRWLRAGQARTRALAEAVSRPYLLQRRHP